MSPESVFRETPPALVCLAPAKINWYLEVLRRRDDGYHELETIMSPLAWGDELQFWPRDDNQFNLQVIGPEHQIALLPPATDNLVLRSLSLLRNRTETHQGMDVRLIKRLPLQAGLGGGSSDAATTLLAANRLWNLQQSWAELEAIACEIGSDVPFFIRGQSALCCGRGEKITPLDGPHRVPCLIICPPFGLSTPEVFRHVDLISPRIDREAFMKAFCEKNLARLTQRMANRLQSAAEAINLRIALIQNTVAKTEPLAGQMTGSGSCFFALYRTETAARRASAWLSAQLRDCRFVLTQTVSRRENLGNNRSSYQIDG